MEEDTRVANDPPVPRQAKIIDSVSLLELEEKAAELGLNQRLPRSWLDEHLAASGRHYLRAALWHRLYHRPEVPPHLRCELILELRDGEQVPRCCPCRPAPVRCWGERTCWCGRPPRGPSSPTRPSRCTPTKPISWRAARAATIASWWPSSSWRACLARDGTPRPGCAAAT